MKMATGESFKHWRSELLHVGNIVQDSEDSVPPEEAEKRFNRYIAMLDALEGTEGYEYALAIMESVQAVQDYGAYQTAERTAWRYGEPAFCQALLHELPRLIGTLPDWAGDFLVSIANAAGTQHQSVVETFNKHLSCLPEGQKLAIQDYIRAQEKDGWLVKRPGVLGGKLRLQN